MASKISVFLHRELNNMRLTLLVSMLFTVLVAVIFPTSSIIFMAALLCTAPVIGITASRFFGRTLAVTRAMPEVGTVGDIIKGRLTVSNRSPFPNFFVHVNAGESKAIQTLDGAEHTVAVLPANACNILHPHWVLRRRGVWQLPPVQAGINDPLGLFSQLEARTHPHTLTVLPRPLKIDRLGFLAGSETGMQSPLHAARVSEAMDFHGIRPWQPGEGIRRVHWKSTARTGQLHIIEWEESLASDLTVLLDTQIFSDLPAKPDGAAGDTEDENELLEIAVTLTASIATYLLENGYQFQLFCWQKPRPEVMHIPGVAESPVLNPAGKGQAARLLRLSSASKQSQNTESSELRLCRHEARNATAVGVTLHVLAEVSGLNESGASLDELARRAAPELRPFSSVVLIASDRSDLAAAVAAIQSGSAEATVTVLTLDSASFHTSAQDEQNSAVLSGVATTGRGNNNAQNTSPPLPARQRHVRRGDSLSAVLEKR
jgi:uncharacterized protein (DUF58 family)